MYQHDTKIRLQSVLFLGSKFSSYYLLFWAQPETEVDDRKVFRLSRKITEGNFKFGVSEENTKRKR